MSAKSVKTVLENHFFTLGGRVMKQVDGGCIGVDMTVELAAIYMLIWDLSLLTKLKKLGVKYSIYKRYVDDIVIVMRAISSGWYFDLRTSKFTFNPDHEYSGMESDLCTLSVIGIFQINWIGVFN